ncbi:epoxide hydrolase family protein [Kribbella endophytica]
MSEPSSSPSRRTVLSLTAAAAAAGATGLLSTQSATAAGTGAAAPTLASHERIRRFQVGFPNRDLVDLRRRIAATRFPDKETVNDHSQGVPLKTQQALATYWATKYDWRDVEQRLQKLPHFITEIDGLDIHFIHVRSKHDNALPLIVTHGWPGSIVEQLKIIEPLTNPTAHGGKASDAFHLVIPSMPGYGFSGKPTRTGWGPNQIATAWIELMRRLGYNRYAAQGGDWGAVVTDLMGVQAPPGLLGIHTNMPCSVPPDVDAALFTGAPLPPGLSDDEKEACAQLAFFYQHIGYARLYGDRPQTLSGLSDSPIALAAYMLDHDAASLALIARTFDGVPEGLSRDDVLDNVTLFWLTNTGVTSGQLYWENKYPFFTPKGVKVPAAVSVFPDELHTPPRSWVEKAYPQLLHYNKVAKGGHFAAWEQPKIFCNEVRNGLRALR